MARIAVAIILIVAFSLPVTGLAATGKPTHGFTNCPTYAFSPAPGLPKTKALVYRVNGVGCRLGRLLIMTARAQLSYGGNETLVSGFVCSIRRGEAIGTYVCRRGQRIARGTVG